MPYYYIMKRAILYFLGVKIVKYRISLDGKIPGDGAEQLTTNLYEIFIVGFRNWHTVIFSFSDL